jgi:Mor family transcriptional regulator
MCPIGDTGAEIVPILQLYKSALSIILRLLYPPQPKSSLSARERNKIIKARYNAGASQADLAREFGISYQRIYQIVHGKSR